MLLFVVPRQGLSSQMLAFDSAILLTQPSEYVCGGGGWSSEAEPPCPVCPVRVSFVLCVLRLCFKELLPFIGTGTSWFVGTKIGSQDLDVSLSNLGPSVRTRGTVLATLAPSHPSLPTTGPSTEIVALSHAPAGRVSSFKELYKENPIFA